MLAKPSAVPGVVAAALALLTVETARAGPVLRVSYIEFSSTARAQAAAQLSRYAARERQAMRSAPTAQFFVTVLQELGRPERWVILQGAASASELAAADAASNEVWQQIEPLLAAPPDRRDNHPMPGHAAAARAAASARTKLYEVTHLDIGAPDPGQRTAADAAQAFIEAAAASRGNRRAEIWQQDGHPNHYAVVLEWASRVARDAFADGPAGRTFRRQLAPLIGSPMDEQLFERRD